MSGASLKSARGMMSWQRLLWRQAGPEPAEEGHMTSEGSGQRTESDSDVSARGSPAHDNPRQVVNTTRKKYMQWPQQASKGMLGKGKNPDGRSASIVISPRDEHETMQQLAAAFQEALVAAGGIPQHMSETWSSQSGVQKDEAAWCGLVAAVTAAAAAAVRRAVDDRFSAMVPHVARALAEHLTVGLESECSADVSACGAESKGDPTRSQGFMTSVTGLSLPAHPSEQDSGGGHSFANVAVRHLESHVADAILEQHGLSNVASSPKVGRSLSSVIPSARLPALRRGSSGRQVIRQVSVENSSFMMPSVLGSEAGDVIIGRTQMDVDDNGPPSQLSPLPGDRDAVVHRGSDAEGSSGAVSTATSLAATRTRYEMLHDRAKQLTDGLMSSERNEVQPFGRRQVPEGFAPTRRPLPRLFHLCGFAPQVDRNRRPWFSGCYQLMLLLASLAVVSLFVLEVLCAKVDRMPRMPIALQNTSLQHGLLSSLPLAIAVVSYLAPPCLVPDRISVCRTLLLLQMYMQRRDLLSSWTTKARNDALLTVCALVVTVACSGFGVLFMQRLSLPREGDVVHLACFAILASLTAAWTQCILYMCRALSAMVDRFCCSMTDTPDIFQAMQEWNLMQAVMLKASGSIEWSFITLLLAISFTVPLLIADMMSLGFSLQAIPTLLPVILLTMMLVRVFFVAAGISDKCARVPALVNSLSFGPDSEHRRQLLIEYIARSDAGFYVRDIRLTTGMALKFMYTWSVVAFGLSTRLIAAADM